MKKKFKSRNNGYKAHLNMQKKFFLSFMLLLACVFAVGALLDPQSAAGCMTGFGGVSFAAMMAIGNVEDVSDKYTFGSNITYQVYLVTVSQLDKAQRFPKPNANREVSTLPMADGQYMMYFEAHDFPTYIGTAEKGDITTSGTNTFSIIMGGIRDKLLTYAEEHTGDKFIILFKEIESDQWEILGSDERPVILKSFEAKNDKDGRYVTYTFERVSVNQYNHYVGVIITAPAAVHTKDSTELKFISGQNLYSIPEGSSGGYIIEKVSGLTASDEGRIVTLNGTGSSNPATISDNTTFILKDGVNWTAKAGSSISFRILDKTTLVEVPNSRVQTA
ncbi:MAG: hypothetical protein LIP08_06430 [Bacteroides sp.]|nr:hypothetical protein [Bacteroides sp.]